MSLLSIIGWDVIGWENLTPQGIRFGIATILALLALQLQFLDGSESMGDHDSGFDDWWSVGRRYADAVGFFVERGQATDSSAVYAGSGRDLG